MKAAMLDYWLHAFFHEWLAQQRNLSHHTVMSYRDTWRLFLRFIAERRRRSVSDLAIEELTANEVLAFLRYSEEERKVTIGTRNCRLAALRSFFRFVGDREPLVLSQCAEVLRIPTKKAPTSEVHYLDVDESHCDLAAARSVHTGGAARPCSARVAIQHRRANPGNVGFMPPSGSGRRSPAQLTLLGKGRKQRICPIWPETADLLSAFLKRQPRSDDEHNFMNRYGQTLGAAGECASNLRLTFGERQRVSPHSKEKHVGPHTFRHSIGVAMVAAGIDVTVIRSLFGHVSLDTTNHYARANLETKRRALQQLEMSTRPGKPPRWKRDPDLLSWLNSL